MTWSKYGSEYADECAAANLSDSAFRTHTEAVAWLFKIESFDCRIAKHLVRRFAGSPTVEVAIQELLACGFWREIDGYYLVMHHREVVRQGLTAQLAKRSRDRKAQSKYRQKLRADTDDDVSDDASDDISASVSGATDSLTDIQTGFGAGGVSLNGSEAHWPDLTPIKP